MVLKNPKWRCVVSYIVIEPYGLNDSRDKKTVAHY
jgi:hypothetical protein